MKSNQHVKQSLQDAPETGDASDHIYMSIDELAPETEENAKAVAYWKSLPRAPGQVPLKSDCDILELTEGLPRCLVLDLAGPKNWPIRMMGTDLILYFGLDATGMNGYDLYAIEDRDQVAERLGILCERKAILYTKVRVRDSDGATIDTEWVFLPLADKNGKIDRLLTSITPLNKEIEPHNFEMDGTMEKRRLLKIIFASD